MTQIAEKSEKELTWVIATALPHYKNILDGSMTASVPSAENVKSAYENDPVINKCTKITVDALREVMEEQ